VIAAQRGQDTKIRLTGCFHTPMRPDDLRRRGIRPDI